MKFLSKLALAAAVLALPIAAIAGESCDKCCKDKGKTCASCCKDAGKKCGTDCCTKETTASKSSSDVKAKG